MRLESRRARRSGPAGRATRPGAGAGVIGSRTASLRSRRGPREESARGTAGQGGVDDDVVLVAACGAVEGAAAGDEADLGVGGVAVDVQGGELVLGEARHAG